MIHAGSAAQVLAGRRPLQPAADDGPLVRGGTAALRLLSALMLAATVIAVPAAGLRIDPISASPFVLLAAVLLVLAWFYGTRRPDRRIRHLAEISVHFLVTLSAAAYLSYAAAVPSLPYRDAALRAADLRLGLDWPAYLAFMNQHPRLAWLLKFAYLSMPYQAGFAILTLTAAGLVGRLQVFVLATGLTLLATIAVFAVAPAVGTYAHLGIGPGAYANVMPYCRLCHEPLEQLRSGALTLIRLTDDMQGVIVFPSFHAASAILFAWVFWAVRRARWVAMALNAGLIAGTPVEGAHYFVDLLGGAVLAALCIAAATKLRIMASRSTAAA